MNDLKKRTASWLSGQATSGNNGLKLMLDAVKEAVGEGGSGDWTHMGFIITGLSKIAPSDARMARKIFRSCLPDQITAATDDKQPCGYRFAFKGTTWGEGVRGLNRRTTEVFDALHALAEEGKSFRSEQVKNALPGAEKKVFDLDKYLSNVVKKLEKEGVHIEALFNSHVIKEAKEASRPDVAMAG